MMKNRSEIDIIMDILSETRWPAKQTTIMEKARLNHKQIIKYLARLVASRLIWRDEARGEYRMTTKGQSYRGEYAFYQRLKGSLTLQKSTLEARRAALRRFLQDT